jgi:hypothetical protein
MCDRGKLLLGDDFVQQQRRRGTQLANRDQCGGLHGPQGGHDRAAPDQAVVLQAVKTPISEGEWHTLVIEIHGAEFLARLDGQYVSYGSRVAINFEKTNIGLTVGGESVSFKNLRIWEATPKADWATNKAILVSKSQ